MRIRIIAVATLLLLTIAVTAAMQSGNDLYQQGLARETAGDIKGAIQIFERLVRDFPSNRPLTAKALVQLGRWSDLLGEEQARKYYERIVREFADQKEAVTEARTRLDVFTKVATPNSGPARRLVVDWPDWNRRIGNDSRRLTRDGRHVLRYNEEQRAFEEVEISTGNVRRLTSEGPNPAEIRVAGADLSPELSTNGRRLAAAVGVLKAQPVAAQASEFERIELRVFEVGGRGAGRVLATWDARGEKQPEIIPFVWSPRDDRIWLQVFLSDQSVQIAFVDMSGKLQVLKTLAWPSNTHVPSLSPDGKYLVYDHSTGQETPADIYIIAADGSHEHRIEHQADDSRPVFMPDGSGVVFESRRRGFRDLWFQGVTDGQPTGKPRLVWRDVGHFGYVQRFTDTGSLLYYFSHNDWGTYTVPLDLNAGSMGTLTRLDPVVNEGNSGAAYSPDGQYLAHFRAEASRIVIRELATGKEREIPLGARLQASYGSASWCMSGDVVIAGGYVNGTGVVSYRVNVKDSSVQRLPISANPGSTLCVGNGDEVIYVPATPSGVGSMIVRRSLVSGRETMLFQGSVGSLVRSLDGKRLAFATIDPSGDIARLVTMPAAGGDISKDLMTSGTINRRYALMDFTWMPTGDRLLVVRADELPTGTDTPPASFWEVAIDGTTPRRLGAFPRARANGGRPAGSFTIHPGGKLLAFQFHEGLVAQTWAIDNLAQFIKAGGGW